MKRAFAAFRTYDETARVVEELVVRNEVPEERLNVLAHTPATVSILAHSLPESRPATVSASHPRQGQILDSLISSPHSVDLAGEGNLVAAGKDAPRTTVKHPSSVDDEPLRECLAALNLADQEIRFFFSEIQRGGTLLWFEIDTAHQQGIIDTLLRNHATRIALYTNAI